MRFFLLTIFFHLAIYFLGYCAGGRELPDLFEVQGKTSMADTIPLKDRPGHFLDEKNKNPFDLKDPKVIDQKIEFDPVTGEYIVTEKIANEHIRPAGSLSFDEFMEFKARQQDREYMSTLAGTSSGRKYLNGLVDPISKMDLKRNLSDRLFGGLGIEITPRGNIDLTVGGFYSFVDNPILTARQKWNAGPDFKMDIQMEVAGNIGDKLKLNTNYNSLSSFDFENQLKLNYDSEKFTEDDIIKKIEAGNVSMPLRSSLIKGSQNLFGIKTEWLFGYLRLTGLISQQRARQEAIRTKGGGLIQEFQLRPDQYDENRHFFLSQFNFETYEIALSNPPEVNSQFKIKDIEVWITEDNPNSREVNVRDIIALADLGTSEGQEFDMEEFKVPNFVPGRQLAKDLSGTRFLPTNTSNRLLEKIQAIPNARELNEVVNILADPAGLNLTQGRDFEKVRAKRLNPNEYTFHPDLGFISLRIRPRPNQVVAVAYQYTYNGREKDPRTGAIYKVGEFASDVKSDSLTFKVMFVKMLKSTNQVTSRPSFRLMMKNVYPIGGFNVNQEDFRFDLFYESQDGAQRRFIDEIEGFPLLNLFRLDNLNKTNDPQPDGIFDWINGQTVIPSSGSIIFPVLEPFGKSFPQLLDKWNLLTNDPVLREAVIQKYSYPQIYDTSVTFARQNLQANQFIMRGSYKASKSNEILLNTVDRNARITVRAGALALVEGVDYTIDRAQGKVIIINEALLQSNNTITVDYENNNLFNFQTRTMLGFRAEYAKTKDIYIGTTFMKLFERPFTQKVNIGEDPINNNVYGLDFGINKQADWLTRALDKLPLYSTKAPSRWSIQGEGAYLRPGYSRAINQNGSDGGVVYVDDFEGSATGIGLYFNPTNWILATPPQAEGIDPNFKGGDLRNNLASTANRALLSWYRVDQLARIDAPDANSPYGRLVDELEIFPNRQRPVGFATELTFDIAYFPRERGPYNFEIPNGYDVEGFKSAGLNPDLTLLSPETRWAGIMSRLNTNDFELANVEYIDFWMLNPFMPKYDGSPVSGDGNMYIQIGTFSEDILRDGKQQFEHGLPTPSLLLPTDNSLYGKVARKPPITNSFDVNQRELQDLGFDGLSSMIPTASNTEIAHYADYINLVRPFLSRGADTILLKDPANDDFKSYRDNDFPANTTVLDKYKRFTMPEGNAQIQVGNQISTAYTSFPDVEDLNLDKSLNEQESYYSYRIPFLHNNGVWVKTRFVTDSVTIPKSTGTEVWYRFRIPIAQFDNKVGQIQDFRSIQSMRLLFTGFDEQVTFRMIKFQLGRNTWRRYLSDTCVFDGSPALILDKVDIEENSAKKPFRYILPPGIQRERFFSNQFADLFQNESSILIRKDGFGPNCSQSVFRLGDNDFRRYKRLKMFVHAETPEDLPKEAVSVFLRFGKDFTQNYYEYEIPVRPSTRGLDSSIFQRQDSIWLAENEFDFPIQLLIDLKNKRNLDGVSYSQLFESFDPEKPANKVKILGNPNVALVRGIMIGMRNNTNQTITSYEIWANELRLTGLEDRAGYAALARAEVTLADLGNLSLAGSYTSIGYGSVDQRLLDRSLEKITQIDATTTLELGKFLPQKWNIAVPFSAQFSNATRTPEYDPNDLDVKVSDKLAQARNGQERDSIRERAIDQTSISGFAFNNVRKNRTGSGKPMPWQIENFALSYGQSSTNKINPIVAEDLEESKKGSLDYSYSMSPLSIEPFKNLVKSNHLKFISQININPIPNTIAIRNNLDRRFSNRVYRFAAPKYATWESVKFAWFRDYNVNWDLTKSIKVNYAAQTEAIVDEITYNPLRQGHVDPRTSALVERSEKRPYVLKNLGDFGRTRDFKQSVALSYNIPTRLIPFMEFIQARIQYNASFNWASGSLGTIDTLGSVISNDQSIVLSGEINLQTLYNKSTYLRQINGDNAPTRGRPAPGRPDPKKPDPKNKEKQKNSKRVPSLAEKILIRPLMSVRRIQFNYTENNGSTIPGFTQRPEFFGMDQGFNSPGWAYVFGGQPNFNPGGFLDNAANNGWITDNIYFNNQMIKKHNNVAGVKMRLEVVKNLNIDLNFDRSYSNNYDKIFKFDSVIGTNQMDFQHFAPFETGQFSISYVSLQTLFGRNIDDLFNEFSENRKVFSQRVGARYGISQRSVLNPDYVDGFLGDHQDVVLPAFLATYSNKNPNSAGLDVFKTLPLPNWQINYNGLARLNGFKEIFQDFSIRHSYKNTLTMSSYKTNLGYEEQNGAPIRRKQDTTFTTSYFSFYEIPDVTTNESFSPLIGLNIKTKSNIELGFDYNKSRNLSLRMALDGQLEDRTASQLTFKFGYIIKNLYLSWLPGVPKVPKIKLSSKKKKKKDEDPAAASATKPKGNDLQITVDFGITDNITKVIRLDENIPSQPAQGSKVFSFTPSVRYNLNKNLNVRFFVDYNKTIPYTQSSFTSVRLNGGLTLQFLLN
ncbi:MAG: cell surface protein SprA [Saprospiraceae bacterium]|nr:cell surface protein SprA [Saprospiraceae bacterium]